MILVRVGRGRGVIFIFGEMSIILNLAISKGKVYFNFSIMMKNENYRVHSYPPRLFVSLFFDILSLAHLTVIGRFKTTNGSAG